MLIQELQAILPALADIGGTAFLGYLFYKYASNHTFHNTQVMNKLINKLDASETRENMTIELLGKLLVKFNRK